MNKHRCLFLWLRVLLWCAGTLSSLQAQSPTDSTERKQPLQRIGLRFGLSGIGGEAPFLGGFTNDVSSIGFEYGKSSYYTEWEIYGRMTRQLFNPNRIATTLGWYDVKRIGIARIILQSDQQTMDGLMLGVGGKVFLTQPKDNGIVFFLRGYTGLHFIWYKGFTLSVTNSNPRVDTIAQIGGASKLLVYMGANPGIEIRNYPVSMTLEFFGWQWYPNYGVSRHYFHVGGQVFF